MCRAVAGSVCRWGARRGACPAGRRLTVPFRNPQGGACLLGYPPPLTLVCFFAPIPPTRARRALFPAGRGSPRLFHARGSAPCIPGAEPTGCRKTDRTAFLLAVPPAKERGDRGRWNYPSQATAAFEMVLSPGAGRTSAAGGLPFLSPANPDFSLLFCPHPPAPFPSGEGGAQGYFMQGAPPLASPGTKPTVRRQSDRKQFPMSSAGSQGEGGPGERNFGV